ncbi:hypothetical protein FQN49_003514 [Arthroderma sp. PD_2]|nr:hypothetical protein FQN49_003514 [Arthroderma sp. PD_2]
MSHVRHCPEFQLARADSKNAATTCQGLTASGQRCRRTVVSAAKKRDIKQGEKSKGDPIAIQIPAGLFCWQHQDQNVAPSPIKSTASRLKGRSSLDTLIERVGVLSMNEVPPVRGGAIAPTINIDRSRGRPSNSTEIRGSSSRRQERAAGIATLNSPKEPKKKEKPRMKFVCFSTPADNEDDYRAVRVRQARGNSHARTVSNGQEPVSRPPPNMGRRPATSGSEPASRRRSVGEITPSRRTKRLPTSQPSSSRNHQQLRPSISTQRGLSQTESLLSWIPSSLSPETTSKLLQKLAEPLSPAEKAGYIYIYCVTPSDSRPQADETASLIPSSSPNRRDRRTSDVMSSAGIAPTSQIKRLDPNGSHTANTIMLKIGRAVNVCRRLTQQCSNNLTLIRYYPYHPSSGSSSSLPQKCPNVHRLERLVHLELSDIRVKPGKPCEDCGKKHQEYFEIEASREQLRRVDECVKRWVEYSQLNPTS